MKVNSIIAHIYIYIVYTNIIFIFFKDVQKIVNCVCVVKYVKKTYTFWARYVWWFERKWPPKGVILLGDVALLE